MPDQSSSFSAAVNKHKGAAVIIALYGGSLLFLCIVAVIAATDLELRLADLTRDPVAVLEGHQLTGLVSTVGILLWTIAASICLFSHIIYKQIRRSAFLARFFLWFGLFTSALLLDDLFMLHEGTYTLRIHKIILFPIYAAFLLLSMRYFRQILLVRRSILFWVSLIFFGASMGVDFLVDAPFVSLSFNSGVFVEDSFKFLGIVSWTSFLVNISFQALKATLGQYPEQDGSLKDGEESSSMRTIEFRR
ncbi:MAG: hypothetical protein AAF773_15015 [Cyanobacteria bacterium P01_D01_bin.115]